MLNSSQIFVWLTIISCIILHNCSIIKSNNGIEHDEHAEYDEYVVLIAYSTGNESLNQYEKIAERWYKHYQESGVPEMHLKYLKNASYDQWQESIAWLQKLKTKEKNRMAVVVFIGHGNKIDNKLHLLFKDSDEHRKTNVQNFYDLANTLSSPTNQEGFKAVLLYPNCCFGGSPMGNALPPVAIMEMTTISDLVNKNPLIVFSPTPDKEILVEDLEQYTEELLSIYENDKKDDKIVPPNKKRYYTSHTELINNVARRAKPLLIPTPNINASLINLQIANRLIPTELNYMQPLEISCTKNTSLYYSPISKIMLILENTSNDRKFQCYNDKRLTGTYQLQCTTTYRPSDHFTTLCSPISSTLLCYLNKGLIIKPDFLKVEESQKQNSTHTLASDTNQIYHSFYVESPEPSNTIVWLFSERNLQKCRYLENVDPRWNTEKSWEWGNIDSELPQQGFIFGTVIQTNTQRYLGIVRGKHFSLLQINNSPESNQQPNLIGHERCDQDIKIIKFVHNPQNISMVLVCPQKVHIYNCPINQPSLQKVETLDGEMILDQRATQDHSFVLFNPKDLSLKKCVILEEDQNIRIKEELVCKIDMTNNKKAIRIFDNKILFLQAKAGNMTQESDNIMGLYCVDLANQNIQTLKLQQKNNTALYDLAFIPKSENSIFARLAIASEQLEFFELPFSESDR